jgi:hypothetical protein
MAVVLKAVDFNINIYLLIDVLKVTCYSSSPDRGSGRNNIFYTLHI